MAAEHEPLASRRVDTERKTFFIDVKKNDRGVYLKITEKTGNKRDTILIPVEAIEGVMKGMNEALTEAGA